MNNSNMLKPALIGGVLLGILSALPLIGSFNCICCAWVVLGSALAARLYVKDSSVPVTLGRGVTLGLLTGAIGTVVYALFLIPLFLMAGGESTLMEQMKQAIERVPNLPPEMREGIDSFISGGHISTILYVVGFFFRLLVHCLVAMIGGAIGVAIFEKRKPGTSEPGTAQYQPPPDLPPPPPASDTV